MYFYVNIYHVFMKVESFKKMVQKGANLNLTEKDMGYKRDDVTKSFEAKFEVKKKKNKQKKRKKRKKKEKRKDREK